MALIKCQECEQQISDKANKCPYCGVPHKKNMSFFSDLFLIALFGVILFGFIIENKGGSISFSGQEAELNRIKDIAPIVANTWVYNKDRDSVSNKEGKSAFITSSNVFELGLPYQGGTEGMLMLRKHPRYGNDVIFSINTGQLLCTSLKGCEVSIRFDDNPPIKVKAMEPVDYSNTSLFLHGYSSLVKKLKISRKAIVEVTFYQQGNKAFEFNTYGLKWDK
jgi:hypothetical protein